MGRRVIPRRSAEAQVSAITDGSGNDKAPPHRSSGEAELWRGPRHDLGTAAGFGNGATIALSVTLAFVFGYALTARRVRRTGLPLRQAIHIALVADTLSIAVMELVDNLALVSIPGATDAGVVSATFRLPLAGSLAIAFVVTVPVNRRLIAKGRGHALVPHH